MRFPVPRRGARLGVRRTVAAALLLVVVGAAGFALGDVVEDAQEQRPPAVARQASVRAPFLLVNHWTAWRPERSGRGVRVERGDGVRISLTRGAPAGAQGAARLAVPAGVSVTALRLRLSFTTAGSVVSIRAGGRTVWSRGPGRTGRPLTVQVPVPRPRDITITLRSVGARRAPAAVRLQAYALVVPGRSVPLPGTSATPRPAGTVTKGVPTSQAGVTVVPAPTGGTTATAGRIGPGIYWGARIGGDVIGAGRGDAPWDAETLDRFEQDAGKHVSLVAWGQPWFIGGRGQRFTPVLFDRVRAHGAIPVLDWSPWDLAAGGGNDQPDFQLQDILDGRYDDYIRQWASDAAAWGHPLLLRFCHEMNGTWYPWSELRNGNSRGQFVQAWRHVHDIFTAAGATNVGWVWAPNEFESYRGIPIESLYPGDDYVDWIGVSGYNWGQTPNGGRWRPFARIFARSYATLRALAPSKPLIISEVAASERGGSKADWLRDAFAVQIPARFPAVRAVVYWNTDDDGMDWPIESSPDAAAAFAESIASPVYLDRAPAALVNGSVPVP